MKKVKTKVLNSILILTIVVMLLSISFTILNFEDEKVEAASQYSVSYKVFKQEDYVKYKKWSDDVLIWFNAAVTVSGSWDDEGTFTGSIDLSTITSTTEYTNANKRWDGSATSGKMKTKADNNTICYNHYQAYPIDIFQNNYGSTIIPFTYEVTFNKYGDLVASITKINIGQVECCPQTTNFSVGDDIVISSYVSNPSHNAIVTPQIALDLDGLFFDASDDISQRNAKLSGITKFFRGSDEDIQAGADENDKAFAAATYLNNEPNNRINGQQKTILYYSGNFATAVTDENIWVGAIGFKIASTGNYNIGIVGTHSLIQKEGAIQTNTAYYENTNGVTGDITSTPVAITVTGSSNSTDLDELKVNGVDLSTATPTSTTINSVDVDTYTINVGEDVSNPVLKISVKDGGTINLANSGYASGVNASGLTGVVSSLTYSISDGGYPISIPSAGSDVYVLVDVTSQDGSATEKYLIKVTRAKYTKTDITSVTFSSNSSISNTIGIFSDASCTTSTTVGNSSNTYYLTYASDATQISATPTYNTSYNFSSVKIFNKAATSGTAVSENISAISGNTFTMEIVPQDTSAATRTITFNIVSKSTDVSLTSVSVYTYDASSHKLNSSNAYTTTKTGNVWANGTQVDSSSASFTLIVVAANNKQTIKIGTSSSSCTTVATSGTECTSVKKSFSALGAAVATESLYIEVTSEFGNTETYEVKVTRSAPSTNTNHVVTITNNLSQNVTYTLTNTTEYTTEVIAKDITTLTFTVALQTGAEKAHVYISTPGATSTETLTKTIPVGGKDVNPTKYYVYINVKSEADYVTPSATGTTYTYIINQNPKSTDVGVTSVSVQTSTTLKTIYPTLQADGSTYKGDVKASVDGNKFALNFIASDSNAKVYYALNSNAFATTPNLYNTTGTPAANNTVCALFTTGQGGFDLDKDIYISVVAEYDQLSTIGTPAKYYTKTYIIKIQAQDERNTDPRISSVSVVLKNGSGMPVDAYVATASGSSYVQSGTLFAFNKKVAAQSVIYASYSVKTVEVTITLVDTKSGLDTTSTVAGTVLNLMAPSANIKTLSTVGSTVLVFMPHAEMDSIKGGAAYESSFDSTGVGTSDNIPYTITIYRAHGDQNESISDLKVNSNTVSESSPYYYNLARVGTTASLTFTIATLATASASLSHSSGSSIVSTTKTSYTVNNVPAGNYVEVLITVTSEEHQVDSVPGTTYTLYIFNASTSVEINSIAIKDSGSLGLLLPDKNNATYNLSKTDIYDASGNILVGKFSNAMTSPTIAEQTLQYLFKSNNPAVSVLLTDGNASINWSGSGVLSASQAKGTSTQMISLGSTAVQANLVVQSEYYGLMASIGVLSASSILPNQKVEIKYYMSKDPAQTNNELDEIHVTVAGIEFLINSVGNTTQPTHVDPTKTILDAMNGSAYAIENLGSVSAASVYVKLKSNSSNAYTDYSVDSNNQTIEHLGTALNNAHSTYTLKIKVYSEAEWAGAKKNYKTYTIILANDLVNLDVDPSAKTIFINDGIGTKRAGYPSKVTDTVTVEGNLDKVYIVVNPTSSNASFTITKTGGSYIAAEDYGTYNAGQTYVYSLAAIGTPTVFTIHIVAQDTQYTQDYTYTFNRQPLDTDTSIKSLSFNGNLIPDFSATKNPQEYTVKLPYSAISTTSTGSITCVLNDSTKQQVDTLYASGSLSVGTNILSLIVKAEDTTVTQTYKVTVIVNPDIEMTALTVKEKSTGNDLITSFSKSTYAYPAKTVAFAIDKLDVAYIAAGASDVNVEVKNNGTVVTNPSELALQSGLNQIEVKVTSKVDSTATTTYTINVTRNAGDADNQIHTYDTEDGNSLTLTSGVYTYDYVLPRTTNTFNPTITVGPNATYTLDSNIVLTPGTKNVKTVTVTPEDGTPQTYTFNIYCANTDKAIDDIKVLQVAGGADLTDKDGKKLNNDLGFVDTTTGYSMNIAYSTASAYIEAIPHDSYAKIYIDSVQQSNKTIGFNYATATTYNVSIYALSEYGVLNPAASSQKSDVYTITFIVLAPSNNNNLSKLEIIIAGGSGIGDVDVLASGFDPKSYPSSSILSSLNRNPDVSFTKEIQSYFIMNIKNLTSVRVNAKAEDNRATVVGSLGPQTLTTYNGTDDTTYVFPLVITVTAEDGTQKTYTVTLVRGEVNLNDDNLISNLSVKDSNGKEYLTGVNAFNSGKDNYEITIPYGPQSFTINAKKLEVSPSIITGDGQYQIDPSMAGTSREYKVFATSQKGAPGTEYKIKVNFAEPSKNTSLLELKVDGVMVPGFIPNDTDNTTYTVSNRSTTISIAHVELTLKESTSTVLGLETKTADSKYSGYKALNYGVNQVIITVVAQSGDNTVYTINIFREYPDPYITNLQITGEKLRDSSKKEVAFDKDIHDYYAVVVYLTTNLTFNVAVDNTDYVVTCSNATSTATTGQLMYSFSTIGEPAVGINASTYTITVISKQSGKSAEYVVHVTRRDRTSMDASISNINIKEIEEFKDEYKDDVNIYDFATYQFSVPNKVDKLDFDVTLGNPGGIDEDGATYKIYGDKELKSGQENNVLIVVTAADGITTKTIQVTVYREPFAFEVNEEAYKDLNITCTKQSSDGAQNIDLVYEVDLGDKLATAIDDYKKYINVLTDNDNIKVEVLTDVSLSGCKEVLLRVTDGSEAKMVRLNLKSTAFDAAPVSTPIPFWIWILLAIILVILVIILVCVNLDKYGSIDKNRKIDDKQ